VIDDDLYRRFKVSAAAHDVSLSDVVRGSLEEFLKADRIIQGIDTLPNPRLILPPEASQKTQGDSRKRRRRRR
jgi:hypothetical protein